MAKDYYAILGIPSRASAEDIKAAYRRLVKEFHPDHHAGGAGAFRDIQEAYATLGDTGRRRAYDARTPPVTAEPMVRARRRPPPEPLVPDRPRRTELGEISPIRSFATFIPSFDDILERLSRHDSTRRRRRSERVEGLTLEITLSREEARTGGRARLMIPARTRCSVCRGRGRLGIYECPHCDTAGIVAVEVPVSVTFPPGLVHDHAVVVPLERFGISNLYMTVLFRPSHSL